MNKLHIILCATWILLAGCNKNSVITNDDMSKPIITLDSPDGIYHVKIGRTLTITPTVKSAQEVIYTWTLDNRTVGTDAQFSFEGTEQGTYHLLFRAESPAGAAQEQLRIDVSELAPPVISFAVDQERVMTLEAGSQQEIAPAVANGEDAQFIWTLDGKEVGNDASYVFQQNKPNDYTLTLHAENEDGTDEQSITVRVVARYQGVVMFPAASYSDSGIAVKTVSQGRALHLCPLTEHFRNPHFEWSVDGIPVVTEDSNNNIFVFCPAHEGTYMIEVVVTDDDGTAGSAQVEVICFGTEESHRRQATASSSRHSNRVYEYTPAPGQFINEFVFEQATTPQLAAQYAHEQLTQGRYVSLGGWGGVIVVGFDHSIASTNNDHDFSVRGNQFEGSSEPGIVWVMQDTNENGEPDDEWYELKGSEYDNEKVLRNYAVTYYRPAGTGMNVQWTDNRGNSGEIPRNIFHTQDSYYPQWIQEQSYTLYGSCLPQNTTFDPLTGFYANNAYAWGYADNAGTDNDSQGNHKVFFSISNAVHADGTPAELHYIDFIKVQTGVNCTAGRLGEISTEVLGFEDEQL